MIDVFRYINLRFEIQHLFPTEVGSSRTVDGLGSDDSTLRSAIAYSAIDEGERPFGDTVNDNGAMEQAA